MSTPDTNNIGVKLQSAGENLNTWGDPNLNNDLIILSNLASKFNPLTVNAGGYTVSEVNYATTNDTEVALIKLNAGTITAAFNFTIPGRAKFTCVWNNTGYTATIKLSATTGFALPTGRWTFFATDGTTDVYNMAPNYGGVSVGANPLDILNMTGVAALITAASSGISGGFAVNFYFTATGGETSKTGADDNGLTLAYTPGTATDVFLNGVKLGSADYVASNGTSITSLAALSVGDLLHIRAWAVFSVANTYTQAQVDALIAAFLAAAHTWPLAQTFTAAASFTATPTGAGLAARFAAPGPVGTVTPDVGNFTTIGATTRGTIAGTTGNFNSTLSLVSGPFSTFGPAANQTSNLQINDNGTAAGGAFLDRFSNDTAASSVTFHKSRSATPGTNTAITTGDQIGGILWRGADGTNYPNSAQIVAVSTGTIGAGQVPAQLQFKTATAAGTLTTALTLGSDQSATFASSVTAGSAAVIISDAVGLLGLKSYTVGTLPTATPAGRMIYVSDGTSNKRQAVSDATNWRWPDGAIVS